MIYFVILRLKYPDSFSTYPFQGWEFNGCHFHGHNTCKYATKESPYRMTAAGRYLATQRRDALVRCHPLVDKLYTIWQCEFDEKIAQTTDFKSFMKNRERLQHACIREAFKGGYTNASAMYASLPKLIKQYHAAHPERSLADIRRKMKIYSADINSQYPSQFLPGPNGEKPRIRVPVTPPISLYFPKTQEECNESCCAAHSGPCYLDPICTNVCPNHCPSKSWSSGIVGYAKVKIRPNRHCRIPLLTVTVTNISKETFNVPTLCLKCAKIYTNFIDPPECCHTDEERDITGTWNLHEIVFACQRQGYEIIKVYNCVFFQKCRSDPMEALMTVLSITKITSTKLPKHGVAEFIKNLNDKTGFNLTEADFHENGALRSVAKFLMVSVIGKQSQTTIRLDKILCHSLQEFRTVCERKDAKISYFELISESCLLVHSRSDSTIKRSYSEGSLFLTNYCNSLSRQMLIENALALQDRGFGIIYFDTDSIAFCTLSPDCPPVCEVIDIDSHRIGAFKLEYSDIIKFIVFAKKTYAMQRFLEIIIKAKGFCRIIELLRHHDQLDLYEQELALRLAGHDPREMKMFQETFRIDGTKFVIDVRQTMKRIRMTGPRKVLRTSGLIRLQTIQMSDIELKQIHCGKVTLDKKAIPDHSQTTVLVADLAGFLPLVPYGFQGDSHEKDLEFLKFIQN